MKPGTILQHNGNGCFYEVESIGTHTDGAVPTVAYNQLYERRDEKGIVMWPFGHTWYRPLDQFEMKDGKPFIRFTVIKE